MIGLRWETKRVKRGNRMSVVHKRIQSKMQYISLVSTLVSLFEQEEFRDLYLKYNLDNQHKCQEGIFRRFCCGEVFKNNQLYQSEPWSLQIEISADEFEVCNPLGAKSGIHKTWGIYFSIKNLPREYSSKLKNTYLLALVNANDVRSMYTDFNNIWRPILNDIKHLEEIGIDIGMEKQLRGTISNVVLDNLGANITLGFAASFSSLYYCRICECDKNECKSAISENLSKYRTIDTYNQQINIVQQSEKVVYSETKGIKFYCQLSNLKYFHVIQNPSLDIMHDLLEGVVPFFLNIFFKFLFKSNILNIDQLNLLITSFDYGRLNNSNKPTDINVEKRSLGLSASQCKCLINHIPYILFNFKDVLILEKYWHGIRSLFLIIETIFSRDIDSIDIRELQKETTSLLSCVISLNQHLTPKLHFISHYGRTIQRIGPLLDANMLKFERMHKIFKDIAKNTRNFININRTMAVKHQQRVCRYGFSYTNTFKHGSLKPISCIQRSFLNTIGLAHAQLTKWLRINEYLYQKSSLIVHENIPFQIEDIFTDTTNFWFSLQPYIWRGFDQFLNSFKVDRTNDQKRLINVDELVYKKPYEIKHISGAEFIMSDCLELKKSLCRVTMNSCTTNEI